MFKRLRISVFLASLLLCAITVNGHSETNRSTKLETAGFAAG